MSTQNILNNPQVKIAIIGAGPIGCILATNLCTSKQQVALVDTNKELIKHIASNGIHITGVQASLAKPHALLTSISQLKDFHPTIIFIATKAWANKVVIAELQKLDLPSCTYVVAQNGLDNEKEFEVLLDTYPNVGTIYLSPARPEFLRSRSIEGCRQARQFFFKSRLPYGRSFDKIFYENYSGRAGWEILRLIANKAQKSSPFTVLRMIIQFAGITKAPGEIAMTFFDPPNLIGPSSVFAKASGFVNEATRRRYAMPRHAPDKSPDKPPKQAKFISSVLSDANLPTKVVSDIRRHEWKKTILNSAMNPLSALHRKTIGEVLQDKKLKKELLELIKEARAVARADGYTFEDTFIEKALTHMALGASHKTSMLQDLELGNKTEISVLSKKIIELGDKYGVGIVKTVRLNKVFESFI